LDRWDDVVGWVLAVGGHLFVGTSASEIIALKQGNFLSTSLSVLMMDKTSACDQLPEKFFACFRQFTFSWSDW